MGNLRLHATEARAFEGTQSFGIKYPWLEHQLDALLGLNPSQEALHDLYFSIINVIA
jgi:hypothetical protein